MINFPSVGRFNPFEEIDRIFLQIDPFSRGMFGRPGMRGILSKIFPAVNIAENRDKYFVRAELPGIKADEIKVQIDGQNLTISGERKIQSEGDNVKYHRRERESGDFSRTIRLPGEIEDENLTAKMVNGVLEVEIPKSEASKPKQITVK